MFGSHVQVLFVGCLIQNCRSLFVAVNVYSSPNSGSMASCTQNHLRYSRTSGFLFVSANTAT